MPKWWLSAVAAVLGAGCLAAFWVGGHPGQGLAALGVMLVVAVAALLGGRFESVRGLRGDGRDEYWRRLDWDATGLAGMVLVTLVIAMAMWEWAHGRDGTPYVQLGAVTGVTYIVAIVGLRLRR
ncbi:MAG TPA: hypothetical protein VGF23_01650 [Gaiellaceae bacterium]|jgi:hypothetical protein